jgi:hypothetical protein
MMAAVKPRLLGDLDTELSWLNIPRLALLENL